MKRKIFITGGGGMLATELESYYSKAGAELLAPSHQELNVLDRKAVAEAIRSFKPDLVFHTAVLHVDACEEDPELAFKLNAWASGNLSRACRESGAGFVYISSCGYFGDEKKFYSEYDPVTLKTVYARSKHAGETLALRENEKTFAVRPGWLFGGSVKHKKNFVYQRYLEAQKSPVIRTAGDKFGSPTYTGDLVKKIGEILETGIPGIYHVSNGGGCSRAEYVKKIVESTGLKTAVEPVDSSHFPRKANVPSCEMMHNWNIKFTGLSPMPSWEEAIERYVKLMAAELKG